MTFELFMEKANMNFGHMELFASYKLEYRCRIKGEFDLELTAPSLPTGSYRDGTMLFKNTNFSYNIST